MKIKTTLLVLIGTLFIACDNNSAPPADMNITTQNIPKVDQISALIAKKPNDASLYAKRAEAWYDVKGFDEAILDYQKAIELDKMQPEYHHALADLYMDYFRSRNGLKVMENAGIIFLKRIPTLLKLAEFQLILKEHPAALRTLDRIEKINPLEPEMNYMRGLVYEDMGKIDEAISHYRFATENNSDFIEAYLKLGNIMAKANPKMALQFFDNAIQVDPKNIDALAHKAYHLSNVMNDIPASLGVYRQLNIVAPQYDEGFYNSGLLYMELDSLDRASQQFTLAIKASPLHIMSYYYRGVAAEKKKDFAQALDDYEQVSKMAPSYQPGLDGFKRMTDLIK